MFDEPKYCILLLPSREIIRRECSLREAAAWLATYNTIMQGARRTAAIVEEGRETKGQETKRRRAVREMA